MTSPTEKPERSLRAEIIIDAPVETVWALVADLSSWPTWTNVLRLDAAELEPDVVVHVWLARAAPHDPDLYGILTDVDAPHRLEWEGGDPDHLHARYVLTLSPQSTTSSLLTHEVILRGRLLEDALHASHTDRADHAGFVTLTRGFDTFNHDLRTQAQTQAGGNGSP